MSETLPSLVSYHSLKLTQNSKKKCHFTLLSLKSPHCCVAVHFYCTRSVITSSFNLWEADYILFSEYPRKWGWASLHSWPIVHSGPIVHSRPLVHSGRLVHSAVGLLYTVGVLCTFPRLGILSGWYIGKTD